jgi:hypothetical protein
MDDIGSSPKGQRTGSSCKRIAFEKAAQQGKPGYPVSRVLRSKITMEASLED